MHYSKKLKTKKIYKPNLKIIKNNTKKDSTR